MIIGGIFGVIIVANMMSEVASRMAKHVFKIISIDPIDVRYIWIEIWIRAENREKRGRKLYQRNDRIYKQNAHTKHKSMACQTKPEQDVFQRC